MLKQLTNFIKPILTNDMIDYRNLFEISFLILVQNLIKVEY